MRESAEAKGKRYLLEARLLSLRSLLGGQLVNGRSSSDSSCAGERSRLPPEGDWFPEPARPQLLGLKFSRGSSAWDRVPDLAIPRLTMAARTRSTAAALVAAEAAASAASAAAWSVDRQADRRSSQLLLSSLDNGHGDNERRAQNVTASDSLGQMAPGASASS